MSATFQVRSLTVHSHLAFLLMHFLLTLSSLLPGVTPMKPGSCTLPLHGIDTVVLDPMTGKIIEGNDVEGVLALRRPWPGIARTCLGDHDRYLTTYFRPYPGYYFTGDAVRRDKDGYYFITGRVDDVLNVSGKL